jgi:hypothetical protein
MRDLLTMMAVKRKESLEGGSVIGRVWRAILISPPLKRRFRISV